MNTTRLILLRFIACAIAVGGCATNAPLDPPSFSLPPIREDTIARLAVDGRNAYINGVQVPHGVYVRDGETVTTGPATSVTLVLNSGASIQLDQNTDPLFRLIRQGACVLMEIIRGQAAVATGGTCVEFSNERLNAAGVAHSLINIRAEESEMRVTVIEGQVDMLRPGPAALRTNDEYVSTRDGAWHVRQLTPADAAAASAWTRNYFRPAARPTQPDYRIPALTAIGVAVGAYILNKDGGDKHPPAQSPQSGQGPAPDRSHPQTAPTAPTAPPRSAPPPAPGGQAPVTPFQPGPAGAAASARNPASGLCCLASGGSMQASALACAARNGDFYPAGASPNRCGPLVP